ncbi:MAG TPA: efflux RND transporter periplasmic adaptor subunit [Alphaproteobacteria bacterium]|nr:efflux RND transporter periplasmic adaptor subunit [Alphaproteobacteria bacterium]
MNAVRLLPVLLLAALTACNEAQTKTEDPPRPVKAQPVVYEAGGESLVFAGTVAPRHEATMAFQVAGKVTARPVDLGAVVAPGTVLARLDPDDYQLGIRSAQAQVQAAEADLARTAADFDRYQRLQGSQVFVKATYDQRRAAADLARANLDRARSQLKIAENQLGYTTLKADAKGVVTAVLAEAGQVLAAGQPVARIARTDELEVAVAIPENRLAAVQAAGEATFTLWSQPDAPRHRAVLREVSPSADPVTSTYNARFAFAEPLAAAQIGMTATLTVAKPAGQPVARLPLTAVFQQDGKPALWTVEPQTGVLTLRPVTVAGYLQDSVLIGGGVEAGQVVVTAGVHKLDSQQRVRILAEAAP